MSLFESIVEKSALKNKNNNALICDNIHYTYSALIEEIKIMADIFKKFGVKKGDKVILIGKNPLHFSISLLTLLYLDAIPMPMYSNIGESKLERIVEFYDVNHIICINVEKLLLKYDYQEYGNNYCYKIFNCMKEQDLSLDKVKLILFTSGTTSTPKAIMLSEENIYSNVSAISQYLKLKPVDSILLIKDLSHSSSIIGELFVGLFNGSSVHMTTRLPLAGTILKLLEDEKISIFFAVPTLLKGILESNKLKNYNLSYLKIINFYGASMNHKDIKTLINTFANVNVIYSYGQTEASPRVTYIEKNDLLIRKGSSGRPIQKVQVSILGNNGDIARPFEVGEILVAGPNIMLGYYKNEMKTRAVKKNKVLYTGDIGYLDGDGFLYVTGRKDNMVISAGKNIYPEEVEGVLTTYHDIMEALVVAREKEDKTCDLIGYVVLKKNAILEVDKLFKYCKNNLELYKMPKEVNVVSSLEKTASGKIIRNQSF